MKKEFLALQASISKVKMAKTTQKEKLTLSPREVLKDDAATKIHRDFNSRLKKQKDIKETPT